ncbi:hypothetical protein BLGI_737 [Brevibacillus laterosporus GI-9]|nr:hypothetical protein BLGI_737 [Brevibacillus laterosporus GI-9]
MLENLAVSEMKKIELAFIQTVFFLLKIVFAGSEPIPFVLIGVFFSALLQTFVRDETV